MRKYRRSLKRGGHSWSTNASARRNRAVGKPATGPCMSAWASPWSPGSSKRRLRPHPDEGGGLCPPENTEDAGLVHLTGNVQTGTTTSATAASALRGAPVDQRIRVPASRAINSHHYADRPDLCTGCGSARQPMPSRAVSDEGEPSRHPGSGASAAALRHRVSDGGHPAGPQGAGGDRCPPLAEDMWFDERTPPGSDFSTYK